MTPNKGNPHVGYSSVNKLGCKCEEVPNYKMATIPVSRGIDREGQTRVAAVHCHIWAGGHRSTRLLAPHFSCIVLRGVRAELEDVCVCVLVCVSVC